MEATTITGTFTLGDTIDYRRIELNRLTRELREACHRHDVDEFLWMEDAVGQDGQDARGLISAIRRVNEGHVIPDDRPTAALYTREGPGPDYVEILASEVSKTWPEILTSSHVKAAVPARHPAQFLLPTRLPTWAPEDENTWRVHVIRSAIRFERVRGVHVATLKRAGWTEVWPHGWRLGDVVVSTERAKRYRKTPPTNRRAKRRRCKARKRARVNG